MSQLSIEEGDDNRGHVGNDKGVGEINNFIVNQAMEL